MVWDMTISTSLDCRFTTWEGDRYMEDTDHHIVHPRVHLGDPASTHRRRSCARQNGQDGRGMAPCWAGATPLLHTVLCPKWLVGRSSPRREFVRYARRALDEAGEEGRNYALQLRLHHLLLLVMRISLGKTRK